MPNQSANDRTQNQGKEPKRSRPQLPDGYGVPPGEEGMLRWSHVQARMAEARNYWITTTRPDGRPHAVPIWGIWVDDRFYGSGAPETRWARNIKQNPNALVHLEDGTQVVRVEGAVTVLTSENAPADLLQRLDDAYDAKYGMRPGTPLWELQPRAVLAWTEYPATVTRWTFE
jgi:hypothetical protein